MNDEEAAPLSATEIQHTPLEKALRKQWYEVDAKDGPMTWQARKERALARLEASADGSAPLSELDEWLVSMPHEWMIRFLIALRSMGNVGLAGKHVHVSPYNIERAKTAFPQFAEAISRAREAVVDSVESSLVVSATVGNPEPVFDKGEHVGWKRRVSEKAAIALLEAERPSKWRKAETTVQIANVLPDAVAVGDALRRLAEVQTIALGSVPQTETVQLEPAK